MKSLVTTFALSLVMVPTIVFADGMADYKSHCAGCHGANGMTLGRMAKAMKVDPKKLNLVASKKTKAEIVATITKGQGKMPSFEKNLNKSQIDGIADYVIGLRKK